MSHSHRGTSLRDIPHTSLEPLEHLPGAEVIVNLDMSGMWRVRGAAELALSEGDPREFFRALNERTMDQIFGGDYWRKVIEQADRRDILGSIAQGYADTFPSFAHRRVYALHGSRSQRRFFVHLTHSAVAADRFANEYAVSFKIGTVLSDGVLSAAERAIRAVRLFDRFKGSEVTLQEMYDLGVGASRSQIASVCRAAEDDDLGEFDEDMRQMRWYEARQPDPDLGLWADEVDADKPGRNGPER